MLSIGVTLAALASLAVGESLKRLDTSLTILVNNDLQGQDSPEANQAVIVTEPRSYQDADRVCAKLGERVWRPESPRPRQTRGTKALPFSDYLQYEGAANASSAFWVVSDSGFAAMTVSGDYSRTKPGPHERHPGLCTNTAPYSTQNFQDTSEKWQISLDVNNQTLTGFRDQLSFRFLGIRFAPEPKRFTYSTLFKGSGESVSALSYGSQCAQGSNTGSEDCLFLNIWTPYLPNPNSKPKKKDLLPVAFWIHGGAFIGGTANDPTFDGGNLASRGDVVVVAINYRLLALGFLALKDGVTNGNFGLADQVTALDWVRAHIRNFGGDPDRITIFGQSAGAGSVRALIASPKAAGKFSGAILLSNLGGLNYGTTYSRYYTIDEQVTVAANPFLAAANCTDAPSQVDCLRVLPAHTLTQLGDVRYLVVDGTYLTSPELPLTGPRLPIRLMMGITRDDGAPFISFPTTTNQTEYLAARGFSLPPETLSLFPLPNTGNATLDLFNSSSRIATDGIFRCIDQATAFAGLSSRRFESVYYYEFDRTYQTGGWPALNVCEAPRTASHPHGDPSKPYLRCHSGELYYVFGTLARQGRPVRDEGDLPFEQFVLDTFAAFIRTGDPNPDKGYLKARGYTKTLEQVERAGEWRPSTKGKMVLRALDWPRSRSEGFRELEQCEALGLGLDYYLR